jgi:hypothetical protein
MEKNKIKQKLSLALVLVFLILFWVVMVVKTILSVDNSFTTYSYQDKNSAIKYFKNSRGDIRKISGSIVANDNYLGTLVVQFDPVITTTARIVQIQIKEKQQDNWLTRTTMNTSSIKYLPAYPFGFPVQADSKGKTYWFELEILNGQEKGTLAFKKGPSIITSKYQYPKKLLLTHPQILSELIIHKGVYAFYNNNLLIISIVYFIPLFIYLSLLRASKSKPASALKSKMRQQLLEHITQIKYPYLYLIIFFIVFDLFILPLRSDIYTLFLISYYIWCIYRYKLSQATSFYIVSILLSGSMLFFMLNIPLISERFAMWSYNFLLIAFMQFFISAVKKHLKTVK